jgi:hypothetical protein
MHNPKSFIAKVLIEEIGKITKTNAYLSFVLIAIGIEFLGKCINDSIDNWNDRKVKSEKLFNDAIRELMPKYQPYRLYQLLRCGLAHYLAPQEGIGLSELKNGTVNLSTTSDGTLVLNVEDFYNDFKCACEKVIYGIDNNVYKNDKMYRQFLKAKQV